MKKRVLSVVLVASMLIMTACSTSNGALKKGDTYTFGNYHGANEWIVLEVKGTSIHLLSKKVIDCRRFDDDDNNWENSEIRKWLNDEYYTEAFSDTEEGLIMETEGDKVSFLTIDEARNLLTDDMWRAEPTEYAVSQGVEVFYVNQCFWWLRSPGLNSFYSAHALDSGVSSEGAWVTNDYFGVRPALWINLES